MKLIARLQQVHWPAFVYGLILTIALSAAAVALAAIPSIEHLGLSALTLAILLGLLLGNTLFPAIAERTAAGVDFSKNILLRLGIILYGFRITFQQIVSVGWSGLVIDVLMIGTTFGLALLIGIRFLKMDAKTVMLIGAGSSICGAAAVMAAEPVVKGKAYQVSVAVATVVVFGTLSMFLYPLLYPFLGLSEHAYGIFAGSTIHEVAQVVVAGKSIGDEAASAAVIEKMLRVVLLAPFLMLVAFFLERRNHSTEGGRQRVKVPLFAVLFVVAVLINSVITLPPAAAHAVNTADTFILTMAMAALGLRTGIGAVRQAGIRPLLLAGCLFVFLIAGGWCINRLIGGLFG